MAQRAGPAKRPACPRRTSGRWWTRTTDLPIRLLEAGRRWLCVTLIHGLEPNSATACIDIRGRCWRPCVCGVSVRRAGDAWTVGAAGAPGPASSCWMHAPVISQVVHPSWTTPRRRLRLRRYGRCSWSHRDRSRDPGAHIPLNADLGWPRVDRERGALSARRHATRSQRTTRPRSRSDDGRCRRCSAGVWVRVLDARGRRRPRGRRRGRPRSGRPAAGAGGGRRPPPLMS